MYAPPPAIGVPVVAAPRRGGLLGSAPLLAVGCILFLLLLIAATIILSLIAVYTPTHGKNVGTSPTYFVRITFPGNASTDGQLSQANLNAIARAIEVKFGLPTGSIVAQSGSLSSTTGSGRRKRREHGAVVSRTRRGIFTSNGVTFNQKIYLQIAFLIFICPQCLNNVIGKFKGKSFPVRLIFGSSIFDLICTIEEIFQGTGSVPSFTYTTTAATAVTGPDG